MSTVKSIEIEGFNLGLIELKDQEALFKLIENNRNRLLKYFPNTSSACKSLASTKNYISQKLKQSRDREHFLYLIYKVEDGVIGAFIIKNMDWRVPKCELAYFIDENYEGRGITSLISKKMIDYCFETLKMQKIYIQTGIDNQGSKRIALKNGFKLEGLIRSDFRTAEGELIDLEYYGLIRDEWKH